MTGVADFLALVVEPFGYGFVLQAMAVGGFVAVVCATLSCFIVLRGWALAGDAIAHAVLPGVILAHLTGLPMALGAMLSGAGCVMGAGALAARCRVKPDALLGICFTGFFAVGMILLTSIPSDVHFTHVLFGNLLGIEEADMIQALLTGAVALITLIVLRRDLVLICFDPAHAAAIGLPVRRLELALLLLLAATTVAALQVVGVVLVVALLVTPGCIGFLMARRLDTMMVWATAATVVATIAGTLASFWLDGATGPCIVLALAALFATALAFAPGRGLLRRRVDGRGIDDGRARHRVEAS